MVVLMGVPHGGALHQHPQALRSPAGSGDQGVEKAPSLVFREPK
jgi:hypothetical protein